MKHFFAILALVSALLVSGSAEAEFAARPVSEAQVMKMLYKFPAANHAIRSYGEIASAIAKASTEDPIFPTNEGGGEFTAALLVSVAWHESRFVRDAVGDNGRSFGLYQIQPPTAKVDSKLLTVPRSASFIAIDLMRKSLIHCRNQNRPWQDGLAWYAASSDYGSRHPVIIAQSKKRMETAAMLYLEVFGSKEDRIKELLLSQK